MTEFFVSTEFKETDTQSQKLNKILATDGKAGESRQARLADPLTMRAVEIDYVASGAEKHIESGFYKKITEEEAARRFFGFSFKTDF